MYKNFNMIRVVESSITWDRLIQKALRKFYTVQVRRDAVYVEKNGEQFTFTDKEVFSRFLGDPIVTY